VTTPFRQWRDPCRPGAIPTVREIRRVHAELREQWASSCEGCDRSRRFRVQQLRIREISWCGSPLAAQVRNLGFHSTEHCAKGSRRVS